MPELKIACVIPALNEQASVAAVIAGCRKANLPVYVVDDGSADATGKVSREAGAEVVTHETNLGKGQSLEDGMARATADGYDAVIFLDSDGQHAPEELHRFVTAAEEGAGLVLGCREFGAKMPFVRRNTNRFMGWVLSKLAGQKLGDTQSGYRLIRTDLWPSIRPESGRFAAESEMLVNAARAGAKIVNVPIPTIYIEGRESHINPLVDSWRFFLLALRLAFRKKTPIHADERE
jgi:UDP-N-acetylglucosamine---dolichyl-phosphate N-acetylglucosaminyltransferase